MRDQGTHNLSRDTEAQLTAVPRLGDAGVGGTHPPLHTSYPGQTGSTSLQR